MVTFTKFYAFSKALAEKKHNLSADQMKIALTNTLPVQATGAILTDLAEIAYTNCSTRNITTTSGTTSAGVYKQTLVDLTLTAAGGSVGPFRYAVLYNDTATSKDLIGFFDYGASLTLLDTETLLIDLDQAAGALTVT